MIPMSSAARRLLLSLGGLVLLLAPAGGSTFGAESPPEDRRATEMLPPTIVALAESPDLGGVLQTILNHPLRQRVEAMPAFQAVLRSEDFAPLQQGIAMFEGSMEGPWPEALAAVTNGGITVALDGPQGGLAVLIKSSDTEQLKRFRDFLLAISQLQQGTLWAAKQGEYRGITAHSLSQEIKLALFDNWLLITNKSALGESIIDRYLDRTPGSLHASEKYSHALAERSAAEGSPPAIAAYLDISALRDAGVAKQVYEEKIDNFVAELLLGGVVANLRHTPYGTASLYLNNAGLRLQVATPHQRDWEPPREYFFGESGHVAAPPLLQVENRLFAISAHRDLSQMWLRSGDLLTDRANDELAKADTQLLTFFSGRDFGEDILGSLESGIQIVGQTQDFSNVLPRPAIKLPAFALQFQMKNPQETTPELRRIFQSFVGFLNVVGAMEGRPQLDLGMESIGDAQLVTASYVPDRDKRESTDAPINFNFTPTLAFAGDRFILSSATVLARELVAQAETSSRTSPSESSPVRNTELVLDAGALQQVLQSNKPQLVANNMLEKGHAKEAAEGEIGLLVDFVGFFQDAKLELGVTDSQLQFNASVGLSAGSVEEAR